MNHFVLVDCNNFYASCERLFNPKLEGCPVIVLSNNDGCVVARSQEAKKLGIKMGEPFFKIKQFCNDHGIVVCSSNYSVYGNLSQRVMHLLSEMAQNIQIYSIDEAFLTFSHISTQELVLHCHQMRQKIKKWTGIPVSIGIAPSKTLAKVANDLAKKSQLGVYELNSPTDQLQVLNQFPLGDIWGVGRQSEKKLNGLGISTALELRDSDPLLIRRKLGVVGERILWELRGVSCLALEDTKSKQSITSSRSFGTHVTEKADLAEALACFAAQGCLKLRKQSSCAQAICVFLESILDRQTGLRQFFNHAVLLDVPTNDTSLVIKKAKACLHYLYRKDQLYKKCGIILLDLIPESQVIPDLFSEKPNAKNQRLIQTIDAVNAHFGKNTLFYGSMGKVHEDAPWKSRCSRRSPHYTSDWNELPLARA